MPDLSDAVLAAPPTLPDWAADAVDLASARLGGEAVACSDDFFAPMARMLQPGPAVWRPGVFDDNGKWMDGWESRRRRNSGHDWCEVRLGAAGTVRGVDVDTSWFTGNYPRAAAVHAARGDGPWREIVAPTELGPNAHHFLPADAAGEVFDRIRLDILPDGGVARLRVWGDPVPDSADAAPDGTVELSALRRGGRALAWNDAHYGDVQALLAPGRGADMGDGWETRRRREPGHDWILIRLAQPGIVERIVIDTAHFKGNFPDRAQVFAALTGPTPTPALVASSMFWPELLGERKLGPDAEHEFPAAELADLGPVDHVRLAIHPDGGVSRLRLFGRPA